MPPAASNNLWGKMVPYPQHAAFSQFGRFRIVSDLVSASVGESFRLSNLLKSKSVNPIRPQSFGVTISKEKRKSKTFLISDLRMFGQPSITPGRHLLAKGMNFLTYHAAMPRGSRPGSSASRVAQTCLEKRRGSRFGPGTWAWDHDHIHKRCPQNTIFLWATGIQLNSFDNLINSKVNSTDLARLFSIGCDQPHPRWALQCLDPQRIRGPHAWVDPGGTGRGLKESGVWCKCTQGAKLVLVCSWLDTFEKQCIAGITLEIHAETQKLWPAQNRPATLTGLMFQLQATGKTACFAHVAQQAGSGQGRAKKK